MKIQKEKLLAGLIVSFILAMSFASASIDSTYNCPMGGMMYGAFGGYGSGMMIFVWIIYILVIALIIAAIYWFVKSAGKKK